MENSQFSYALVIVDMQEDFVLPDAPAPVAGALETVPCIASILKWFREKELPVFHVVRQHREDGSDVEPFRKNRFLEIGGYAVAGTPGCEIIEPLKPAPGEYLMVKKRFSAFMNTEFDLILRQLGVTHLAVCGTQYPTCIRTTVFDAAAYGYNVTLLTDATSAQTQEIADANIRDISNIGVQCITTDQFKKSVK